MSKTQRERSEHTRAALVRAARDLFTERGYAETSTPEIVSRAGVTRGALYHQFADKLDLFRAVYEQVERELTLRIAGVVASQTDPVAAMRTGVETYLDACLEPDVRRIVLQEGVSVLGWTRKREIDESYGLGLIRYALQGLADAGHLRGRPLEPLAHVLFGAINESAMLLGHADDPAAEREGVESALHSVLDALLTR